MVCDRVPNMLMRWVAPGLSGEAVALGEVGGSGAEPGEVTPPPPASEELLWEGDLVVDEGDVGDR